MEVWAAVFRLRSWVRIDDENRRRPKGHSAAQKEEKVRRRRDFDASPDEV